VGLTIRGKRRIICAPSEAVLVAKLKGAGTNNMEFLNDRGKILGLYARRRNMKIKADDVFIYILNIAGAIVSQNSNITPEEATKRAIQTLCYVEKCADAWAETHDENGNLKDPLELLKGLGEKLSPESMEKLGDIAAKRFG
jgi:hypothetical protein